MNTEKPVERAFTLKPAVIDFLGPKTEMVIATIIAILTCLIVFGPSLTSGFLLDDLLHIDYVAKAQTGNWSSFLANFTGNWAGSDIMKSYRPLVSLSLYCDYLAWGTNAWGFHLSNVLLTAASAMLVGLIALELCGLTGNRLSATPAVWAALIFAVYPLHPEATTWIIGRVDLLCTVFYLASLLCYLRFRSIRERTYFHFSLIFFVAALLCKEMAVTLPLVITFAEILLYGKNNGDAKRNRFRQITTALSYWYILGAVAGLRIVILGTLVGGYEGSTNIIASLRNFIDKATLLKLFIPVNEETAIASWVKPALLSSYGLCLISASIRIINNSLNWRIVLFLLAWITAGVLPTYQIWHIHPNLVGSRLFYLSSAPFAILIAFLALPAIDRLPKIWVKATAILGSLALLLLIVSWSAILQSNLTPWQEAGKRMSAIRQDLEAILSKNPTMTLLLLNLPTDYSGAGMLTRQSYLEILCRPPFCQQDYSKSLRTIEPEISGSHDFLWPERFLQFYYSSKASKTLIWSSEKGQFSPWQNDGGEATFDFHITDISSSTLKITPQNLHPIARDKWSVEPDSLSQIQFEQNAARIHPGQEAVSILFPEKRVNPLSINLALFDMTVNDADQAAAQGRVKLIWHESTDAPDIWKEASVPLSDKKLWLGRYRNWTLARSIDQIGLKCEPGNYEITFRGLEIDNDKLAKPLLIPISTEKLHYMIPPGNNAKKIMLLVSSGGHSFDANAEAEISLLQPPNSAHSLSREAPISGLSGEINIPTNLISGPGPYQVRIQTLDPNNQPSGLPSEPITIPCRGSE